MQITKRRTHNLQFAKDIRQGFMAYPKSLSSKYFYDAEGSRIFQQIMELEEYYLTNCEFEILNKHKAGILNALPETFDLVELGAGDGLKTKILLSYFLAKKVDFLYMPIDISTDILEELSNSLQKDMPDLTVVPHHDDYFGALQKMSTLTLKTKVVLFLGSNIGNFSVNQAEIFLKKLRASLHKDDLLLLGADLVKNPKTILAAYNDAKGVTASFNYNLLQRINEEFNANFDVSKFLHHPTYNPQTGETKSYLVSREEQTVWIEDLSLEIYFKAWETIHTEVSQKFTIEQLEHLAIQTGFKIKSNFFDSKNYFIDALWQAV